MRFAAASRRNAARRPPASARPPRPPRPAPRSRPPRLSRSRLPPRRRNPPDLMDLRDRAVALYGRFSAGERDRLQRDILSGGGVVARDLTRRSDLFVVGALATALVDSGALGARLAAARERGLPIFA